MATAGERDTQGIIYKGTKAMMNEERKEWEEEMVLEYYPD